MQKQIGNRDHQTFVQSQAQSLPLDTCSLRSRLSLGVLKRRKRREDRGRHRDRGRKLREELDDLNADKRMLKMKDHNEGQRHERESTEGRRREKEGGGGGREDIFLPVVDTVSAVAIRARKTHQRFVCSV